MEVERGHAGSREASDEYEHEHEYEEGRGAYWKWRGVMRGLEKRVTSDEDEDEHEDEYEHEYEDEYEYEYESECWRPPTTNLRPAHGSRRRLAPGASCCCWAYQFFQAGLS